MTLTAKQISDLNGMNEAARLSSLGTLVGDLDNVDGALLSATAGVATASKAAILGANKNLDVLAIADLKLGAGAGTSVTKTAAEINLLVTGVAGGYKVAYGTTAIGAASEDIATGLTTVVGAVVSLVGDPSMTHMFSTVTVGNQTNAPIAGSIRVKSFKPTAVGDVTPIAADTTFANVSWVAFGT